MCGGVVRNWRNELRRRSLTGSGAEVEETLRCRVLLRFFLGHGELDLVSVAADLEVDGVAEDEDKETKDEAFVAAD